MRGRYTPFGWNPGRYGAEAALGLDTAVADGGLLSIGDGAPVVDPCDVDLAIWLGNVDDWLDEGRSSSVAETGGVFGVRGSVLSTVRGETSAADIGADGV